MGLFPGIRFLAFIIVVSLSVRQSDAFISPKANRNTFTTSLVRKLFNSYDKLDGKSTERDHKPSLLDRVRVTINDTFVTPLFQQSRQLSEKFNGILRNEPKEPENTISLGFLALILSIVFCPTSVAKYLLNNGVSVQTVDFHGITISPIFMATCFTRKDIIKLLISHGADINDKQFENNSILEIARLGMHNYDMYQFLIDNGADINSKDYNRMPELCSACLANDTQAVELLINAGVNIDMKTDDDLSALVVATLRNNSQLVDMLLEGGADVNIRTAEGYTPLHMAVQKRCIPLVDKLLQAGADINAVDNSGKSVLHHLFRGQYDEYTSNTTSSEIFTSCLTYLLDNGAKILNDNEGQSPLDPVYMNSFDSNIMQLLLDRSEDVEYRNQEGESLLYRWCLVRDLEAVKFLINNGADVNSMTNCESCGLLIIPIASNDIPLLDLLLQYEHSDTDMTTALTLTLVVNKYTCADIIFKKCSTLSKQDALVQMIFRHGSGISSLDLIKRLLEMGADPNLTGTMPYALPLISPALSNKADLVELLLAFGADPDAVISMKGLLPEDEAEANRLIESISESYGPTYHNLFPKVHKLDNLTPEELTVRVIVDAIDHQDIITLFDEHHDSVVASSAPLSVCALPTPESGPVCSLGSDWAVPVSVSSRKRCTHSRPRLWRNCAGAIWPLCSCVKREREAQMDFLSFIKESDSSSDYRL